MYGINVDTARIVTDHMQTDADGVKNGLGDLVTVQIQPCSRDQCYGTTTSLFSLLDNPVPRAHHPILSERLMFISQVSVYMHAIL